jgi:ubiquinone/menaquinone biosynthesis C-methylase UbiE
MFRPEPQRAIGEIRRVLKPGGWFGIVVWDERSLISLHYRRFRARTRRVH